MPILALARDRPELHRQIVRLAQVNLELQLPTNFTASAFLEIQSLVAFEDIDPRFEINGPQFVLIIFSSFIVEEIHGTLDTDTPDVFRWQLKVDRHRSRLTGAHSSCDARALEVPTNQFGGHHVVSSSRDLVILKLPLRICGPRKAGNFDTGAFHDLAAVQHGNRHRPNALTDLPYAHLAVIATSVDERLVVAVHSTLRRGIPMKDDVVGADCSARTRIPPVFFVPDDDAVA